MSRIIDVNPLNKMFFTGGTTATLATNGTDEYFPFCYFWSPRTTELDASSLVALKGRFKKARISLRMAPGAGKSRTFTLRKNQGNTSITITISDAATTGSDLTHEAEVDAGDYVTWLSDGGVGTPIASKVYAAVGFIPY